MIGTTLLDKFEVTDKLGGAQNKTINIATEIDNKELWQLKEAIQKCNTTAQVDIVIKEHGLDNIEGLPEHIKELYEKGEISNLKASNVNNLINQQNYKNIAQQAQGIKGVKQAIDFYNDGIKNGTLNVEDFNDTMTQSNSSLGKYLIGLNGGTAGLGGYAASLATATLKTIGLSVATAAMNAAVSFGVSTAISGIISMFTRYSKSVDEAKQKATEMADKAIDEEDNIESLITRYNKLDKADRSTENTETIKELNEQINKALGSQADNIDLVNGKLDEQSDKLRRNLLQKLQDDKSDIDANAAVASSEYEKGLEQGLWGIDTWGFVSRALKENGVSSTIDGVSFNNVGDTLRTMDADKQFQQLKEWRDQLSEINEKTGNYGDELISLQGWYNELKGKKEKKDKALEDQKLRDEKERILEDWDSGKINDVEAFEKYRKEIQATYEENSVLQNQMLDFIDLFFPDYAKEAENAARANQRISKSFTSAWDSIGTTGNETADKKYLAEKERLEELAAAGKPTEKELRNSSLCRSIR